MAVLINRNPNGRLICLHALVKTLDSKFGEENNFTINDLKYDQNSSTNITDCCELLVKPVSVSHMVCPYLDNPLSEAKCYLTQSIQHDTQKSKSASDAMNALDGLGFVKRGNSDAKLTKLGIEFAKCDFQSKKWLSAARKAVLSYGPFIGLLSEIIKKGNSIPLEISKSDITLGFPQTKETVRHNGNLILLSTGSQDDTITRTRAVLFSWAVTTGFAVPKHLKTPATLDSWHLDTREFVEQENWSTSKYKFFIPDDLFDGTHYVNNPINYNWMTKSTKALRERGQEDIRKISLIYEPRVKNRRFAIVYALAKCADKDLELDFSNFVTKLKIEKELFVIDDKKFEQVMSTESKIADICGIPFSYKNGKMKPLTKINIDVLKFGASSDLVKKIDSIIAQL